MSTLATPLRRQLENTIKQARKIAEAGALHALEALAVHEPNPYEHMDEEQRGLRRKLRAQARQLGDGESQVKRGAYEIKHLVEKLAYDQWHRLLFARYLLENNLLISPEHGVSVSLDDCEELNLSLGLKDAWAVAARFAAVELPEIFRADDSAGAVEMPVNDRQPLIALVTGLPMEVFIASDSLGWCYQFWQAERKEEVNKSGNKIGADELPSVTQLFTEDYMVDFLLDNTLGAWHAGKVLNAEPTLADNAQSEDELRNALALPGCPWRYLRFVKDSSEKWTPAAGIFAGWPKTAKELKCLDPCMGSGHFVVAMFERLVALRLAEENMDEAVAVSAVISDNLFGLEIDSRCTQIGAFNLALAAWRRVGHCKLPVMNLACSGLAPNTREADWLAMAGDNEKLKYGIVRLYRLFKDAPVLGSLINPRLSADTMFVADYQELQPLLEMALAQEKKDDTTQEMAVTAHGLAKAAEFLADRFTLVATNVPYLGRGDQVESLKTFLESNYPNSKTDLATSFIERALEQIVDHGSISLVVPRIWLTFTAYYRNFRKKLLSNYHWNILILLGKRAFQTFGGEIVDVALIVITKLAGPTNNFTILNVCDTKDIVKKQKAIATLPFVICSGKSCLSNPGYVPTINNTISTKHTSQLLKDYVSIYEGISRGDTARFDRYFWELPSLDLKNWRPFVSSSKEATIYGGASSVFLWERGKGELSRSTSARVQGIPAWNKSCVFVSRTHIVAHLTNGAAHSQNGVAIMPNNQNDLPAIYHFCSSETYRKAVLALNQKLIKPTGVMGQVNFDIDFWRKAAGKLYPNGLPKPQTSDPTQWIFDGNPKDSDNALHVAVARLLGYQWPRQTGSSFPHCPKLVSDGLESLAVGDGILCLSPNKGKSNASVRLREILAKVYGQRWDFALQEELLGQVCFRGATLEDWLQNGFFEQHCRIFKNRPFIWHIWDGEKFGFSALVNYHKLTHSNLEKLTYAYLGDWIRWQKAAVEEGEAGSDTRLLAAKKLQSILTCILEGEPPYDIFVRWKPLSKQAIGWNPDINDGVRVNIRPFYEANILRKKMKINWNKDNGTAERQCKDEWPWLWNSTGLNNDTARQDKFCGIRLNNCHYSLEQKIFARKKK